ncbi:unnamed protein product [Coregonus sp. 'balchen']|nr:unnamed protein product [Coregonus sp. 'balchen']
MLKYTQGPHGRVWGSEAPMSCFILGGEMWQGGSEDPETVPKSLIIDFEMQCFKMIALADAVFFAILSSYTVGSVGNASSMLTSPKIETTTEIEEDIMWSSEEEDSTRPFDPCFHYTVLDQAWRATNTSNKNQMCDRNVKWQGWYRLLYKGNSLQMPERQGEPHQVQDFPCERRRAFNRRTGVFQAPVKGVYQFFFSTQSGKHGVKTDLWLLINGYWVTVSHTNIRSPATVGNLSTYMTFLRRGTLVYVSHDCGSSWANAASNTITFGGSLLVQLNRPKYNMAEHESLEFGKADFVLLDNVSLEEFMANLKLSWTGQSGDDVCKLLFAEGVTDQEHFLLLSLLILRACVCVCVCVCLQQGEGGVEKHLEKGYTDRVHEASNCLLR